MSERARRSSLEEISIRGLGVIDAANIEFSPGFTVLTGETGAGKTMVLTALALVLGSKSDVDLVRKNAERTVVSARFSVDELLVEQVLESGGDSESGELIITRTVSQEGKSRISLGGALSTATKVADIAESMIEVHAQSTNLRIAKPQVQREVLDKFGGTQTLLDSYEAAFLNFNELQYRILELKKESAKREIQIADLKEFAEAFSKVMPEFGELEDIENEIAKLGSVEYINAQLSESLTAIEGSENSALNQLQIAKRFLESARGKDSLLDRHIGKFVDAVFNVTDANSDLIKYLSELEADPDRFDFLQKRKAAINSLIKKFGVSSDKAEALNELISEYESATQRLQDLEGGDARIAELERSLNDKFSRMREAALSLSDKRSLQSEELAKEISAELTALSMPNSRIWIKVEPADSAKRTSYSIHGLDEVSFYFVGHHGGTPLLLSKVASGGEMSRVMLALEVVIAQKSPVGTYIFDEVDAGVGGKAAVEVGRRLSRLGKEAQVIVVTHLPQVAVWADRHLVVKKDESGSVTQSDVILLSSEERKVEIARMLSGHEDSQTAREHAAELLELVKESVIS